MGINLPVLLLAVLLAMPAGAANISAVNAGTYDIGGIPRTTFSSGESIMLRQAVTMGITSPVGGQVAFKFTIKAPDGSIRFRHTGNQAPGTAGGAQSQLTGISIASFYTTPGQYTYVAEATLDGETVAQQSYFTISSPNITLIYPPYGARGLSDNPLTFRWVASGASRYRVTVSDNASLYNPMHTGTNSGESTYSYPANPTQPREQLVPDQVYHWKVEGLDASNNVISESNIYNFSLKSQASSQSRNLTVTSLDLTSPALDFEKPLNFKAVLRNTGNTTETNLSVRFTLGGVAAQDSPKQVASIAPGEIKEIPFTAFVPAGEEQALAVACSDLFDDNIPDNCKTKLISKSAGSASGGVAAPNLSFEEMFQAILRRLGPDAANALEGYTFSNLSCTNCSQSELSAIINALISGEAQLVNAAVTDTGGGSSSAGQTAAASAQSGSTWDTPGINEETLELAAPKEEQRDEWTGYTEPRKGKEPSVFVIRSRKEWKKVWSTISTEEEPEIDFGDKMVAGIISGSADKAEAIRLIGQRRTDTGIVFDYYVVQAPDGRRPPASAYMFKVYPKSEDKVDFNRLDVSR